MRWTGQLTLPPRKTPGTLMHSRQRMGSGTGCISTHYSDGRGSLWGYTTETFRTHGRQVTVHPQFTRWRYTCGEVPADDGVTMYTWRWADAPGELTVGSKHGERKSWVTLLPKGGYFPPWLWRYSPEEGEAEVLPYPDGREIWIVGQ
jgi:hypothetical protein